MLQFTRPRSDLVRLLAAAAAMAASPAFAQFTPMVGSGTGTTSTGFNPLPFERITATADAFDGGAMGIAPGQTVRFGMTTVADDNSVLYGATFNFQLDVWEGNAYIGGVSRTLSTGANQKLHSLQNVFTGAIAPAAGQHTYDTRVRVTVDGVTRTNWGFYTVIVQ